MSNLKRTGEIAARPNALWRSKLVTTEGRPLTNLQASYSMLQGTVGVAQAGPFTDRSGQGHNATIKLGNSPTQRSSGLEQTDVDGIVYNSNVNVSSNATIIMAVKSTIPPTGPSYPGLIAPADNGFPAVKTDAFGNNPHPYPNMWIQSGDVRHNTFGLINNDAALFSGRPTISALDAPADDWNVIAYAVTGIAGPNGMLSLWTLGNDPKSRGSGYVYYKDTTLLSYFSPFTSDTWCFGLWPYGLLRPATGFVGLCDIYNTILQSEIIMEVMRAQAREMYGRGVTVRGYPYPKL